METPSDNYPRLPLAAAPRLLAALRELVDKLALIHGDSRYSAVWIIAQSHMGPYKGPTYTKEFDAASVLLAELEGEHDSR